MVELTDTVENLEITSDGVVKWEDEFLEEIGVEKGESPYREGVMEYQWTDVPENLVDVFRTSVSHNPDRTVLIIPHEDVEMTYRELDELSERVAQYLRDQEDIGTGDVIATFLDRCSAFVVYCLAAHKIGAIPLTLNTGLAAEELKFIVNDAGPELMLVDPDLWDRVEPIQDELDSIRRIYFHEDRNRPSNVKSYSQMEEYESSDPVQYEPGHNEICLIMYTSGTTGLPKGVTLTHRNMTTNLRNYEYTQNLQEGIRTLIAVPLFHITGYMAQLWQGIYQEGTVVVMEEHDPKLFAEFIGRYDITHAGSVPATFQLMLGIPDIEDYDLSSLKTIGYGGAGMPVPLIEKLRDLFPEDTTLQNAYGFTESASPVTVMPDEYTDDFPGGVLPVPTVELKLVDESGDPVDFNQIGRILTKGPQITPGYWKNEEKTMEAIDEQGFFDSGDAGSLDQHGFLYIEGRIKHSINRGGETFYTAEIENAILNHPGVLEAAVTGVPDEVLGERVLACVVPEPGETVTEEEINDVLEGRLSDYKKPEIIRIVSELPKNPGGKVMRGELVPKALRYGIAASDES